MENEIDLSKPFVKSYTEGEFYVLETNLPNDSIGDFAFEWDIDGSQRKDWEKYLKELEEKGIRGNLRHQKLKWLHDDVFDKSDLQKEFSLQSYKFLILDLNEL